MPAAGHNWHGYICTGTKGQRQGLSLPSNSANSTLRGMTSPPSACFVSRVSPGTAYSSTSMPHVPTATKDERSGSAPAWAVSSEVKKGTRHQVMGVQSKLTMPTVSPVYSPTGLMSRHETSTSSFVRPCSWRLPWPTCSNDHNVFNCARGVNGITRSCRSPDGCETQRTMFAGIRQHISAPPGRRCGPLRSQPPPGLGCRRRR